MNNYENLKVWQRSILLAEEIYKLTEDHKFQREYSLRDQIRRSVVSISSKIAEGDELDSDKQAVRHFYIAKGSAAELTTQLIISKKIGYISDDRLIVETKVISSMLMGLIKSRYRNTKSI